METIHPNFGFASQTSLSGHHVPATPPYTPAKHKRRLERSDSPASSVHPTETSSPATKVLKRSPSDNLQIVELPEGDIGFFTGADVISPAELEEAEDYINEGQYDTDESDSDSGISSRFAQLDCNELEEELEMTRLRRERRMSRRTYSRLFKRSHSQIANSGTDATDTDAPDDGSGDASIRRLRRRVQSPVDGIAYVESRGSPQPGDRYRSTKEESNLVAKEHDSDAFDSDSEDDRPLSPGCDR